MQASRTSESLQQQRAVQKDPYGPTYPESAAQFILYRIGITIFAVIMIVVGKSNLPDDAVSCIEDGVIDTLRPVTDFYNENKAFGLTLMTLMQLIVDVELIAMAALWYFKGSSFRYPIVLAALGISKILLNVLFQVRPIDNSFSQMLFPSLVFGESFKNTYFFSGVTAFLLFNLLQLRQMKYIRLMWAQTIVLIFCSFCLLSMRQNFFMDVMTALVFSHYVFVFVCERSKSIDNLILSWIYKSPSVKENS